MAELTADAARERYARPLFVLTIVTIYWATGTITPSMRDYFDNRWHGVTLGPDDVVRVPTGIAIFDHEFATEGSPPREWAERLYQVTRWTELLARDIAAFFGSL